LATIEDVARLAGVSPATASRAVGARHAVREANRAKVMAAVRALNYVPNLAARSLASAARERIGLLYDQHGGHRRSALLPAAVEQCLAKGAELVLAPCAFGDPQAEHAAFERLREAAVGAVLWAPSPLTDARAIGDLLRDALIPVVTLAAGVAFEPFSAVAVDDQAASREATEHLLALGHCNIAFIAGPATLACARAQRAGFEAAIAAAPHARGRVTEGDLSFASGLAAAQSLLNAADPPTAIFAASDEMAAAALSVAQRLGLEVPGDLAVVGYDDSLMATLVWPALTTVLQPLGAMAAAAVDLALSRIRAARGPALEAPVTQILAHALVARQSSAPPREVRVQASRGGRLATA
jgi:LacI family transcriptional regulator